MRPSGSGGRESDTSYQRIFGRALQKGSTLSFASGAILGSVYGFTVPPRRLV